MDNMHVYFPKIWYRLPLPRFGMEYNILNLNIGRQTRCTLSNSQPPITGILKTRK